MLTVLFFIVLTPVMADIQEADVQYMDSVEISLLTCEPHDEIYSLYGHTAIRYHDLHPGGIDATFNYGVFNFKTPHFALRFVFGRTDYELGAYPYRLFLKEYEHFGSEVSEQVLNLTSEEKMQLRLLLAENMLPENTVYRYNYFYNNCTTKARDIIEKCINGRIEYTENKVDTKSYREMVREMTKEHPWAAFGNDLLLGVNADKGTTLRQQEFLPHNLMRDFDHAQIITNGQSRPLVKTRRIALPAGTKIQQEGFPVSPFACGVILTVIGFIICCFEYRRQRAFRWWDVLLMVATGSIGIILFLMLFSLHPTVSLNLMFILFNPLPWFFLWPVIKRRKTRYWTITAYLAVLFIIFGFIQDYPEGVWSLALCLLLQCYIHLKRVSQ